MVVTVSATSAVSPATEARGGRRKAGAREQRRQRLLEAAEVLDRATAERILAEDHEEASGAARAERVAPSGERKGWSPGPTTSATPGWPFSARPGERAHADGR